MAASCFAALLFTSAVAQPDAVDASADSPAASAGTAAEALPSEAPPVNEPSVTVPVGSTATPVAEDAAAPATEPGVGAEAAADSSAPVAEVIATDAVVLPPAEPAPPAKPRYNKDDVRWIQQRLQELGYYNGAIDGAYGRVTREAIKSYQVDQELEQDGRPTPELREFMWRNGG